MNDVDVRPASGGAGTLRFAVSAAGNSYDVSVSQSDVAALGAGEDAEALVAESFRFLLERWTYEEVNARFRKDPPENCSVTVYEHDVAEERMALREYNTVHWKDL